MRATQHISVIVALVVAASEVRAAETCGNGLDDDANSMADESCYPTGVTGVCESPLSCATAGAIAPKSGILRYEVLPDISPRVAYGPSITLVRRYASHYDPGYFGGSTSDYRDSLGYDWSNNWAGWLDRAGSAPSSTVVLHNTEGQDVYFSYSSADATWHYYTPQKGYHFKAFKQRIASPYDWELVTLTGTTYTYDDTTGTGVGKLTGVKDAAGNTVAVTYDANGKLYRVTDATTTKYIQFEYSAQGKRLLQYAKFYADGTLRATIEYGYTNDALTSVSNGGTTVESYAYTSGYLTSVTDGDSKTLATFAWTSGGKAVRVNTPSGDAGYSFADSGCNNGSGTYLYYNRANTTACDDDADCGSGNYCGGETNPASLNTGQCFEARRCLAYTAPSEEFVDTVTASCTSCVDVADYDWDTANFELDGKKSADNVWTSYLYNSDGMVTKMVENDTDSNASTVPSGARVTYYFYGTSSFPGLVTEVRRLSELKPSGTCTDTTSTDCKRTVYSYTTSGLLDTVQEIGFTLTSTAAVTSYNFTTDHDYDSQGRRTITRGPRSGVDDNIEYTYWDSSDGALSTNYLKEVKHKKATSTYITTTLAQYDFWGKPRRETDSNSKSRCRTYESRWGLETSSRIVVDGSHTDCTQAAGSNDETRSLEYDTHRRLTRRTLPRGNCWRTTYDSEGRVSTLKQADYDSGTGACGTTGDYFEYTYDDDGLLTKTEWKDSTGAIKRTQESAYGSDRRTARQINAVSTTNYKSWSYDADGIPVELQWEDYSTSEARRQWDVDNLNRTTNTRDYLTSATNEECDFTPGVQFDLPTQISDPGAQNTDLVWDDLRRKVKQTTPESGITILVYDEAGNLTTQVENYSGGNQITATFAYDSLNRRTSWDTGDTECTGGGGAEIQYTYDSLPTGEACPTGSSCDLPSGHLAYVKTQIYCDAGQGDKRFDQRTYYSYREGGLIEEHTVKDDAATPRVGRVAYSFDKNHNVTRVDYPTGSSVGAVYTFGDASASTDDKVSGLKRDTTDLLTSVTWHPFGPFYEYTQANAIQGTAGRMYPIKVTATVNAAYRRGYIYARSTDSTPSDVFRIDFSEDVRQRYTKRDFSHGSASQKDMFFLYDDLSRLSCRTTSVVSSCPGANGQYQMETMTYNTSSDRTQLVLSNAVISTKTYNTKFVQGTSNGTCQRL